MPVSPEPYNFQAITDKLSTRKPPTSLTLWISSTLFNSIFCPPRVCCHNKCKPLSTAETAQRTTAQDSVISIMHMFLCFQPPTLPDEEWWVVFLMWLLEGLSNQGWTAGVLQDVSEHCCSAVEPRDSGKELVENIDTTLISVRSINKKATVMSRLA